MLRRIAAVIGLLLALIGTSLAAVNINIATKE